MKLHTIANFMDIKIWFISKEAKHLCFTVVFEGKASPTLLGKAAEVLVKWFEAFIRRVEGSWKLISSTSFEHLSLARTLVIIWMNSQKH